MNYFAHTNGADYIAIVNDEGTKAIAVLEHDLKTVFSDMGKHKLIGFINCFKFAENHIDNLIDFDIDESLGQAENERYYSVEEIKSGDLDFLFKVQETEENYNNLKEAESKKKLANKIAKVTKGKISESIIKNILDCKDRFDHVFYTTTQLPFVDMKNKYEIIVCSNPKKFAKHATLRAELYFASYWIDEAKREYGTKIYGDLEFGHHTIIDGSKKDAKVTTPSFNIKEIQVIIKSTLNWLDCQNQEDNYDFTDNYQIIFYIPENARK